MTITKFAPQSPLQSPGSACRNSRNPRVLTLDAAQAIAQETLSNCRAAGYKVTVLVVDSMNAPKAMMRDDGATASTTEVAKMKATAIMLSSRPLRPCATSARRDHRSSSNDSRHHQRPGRSADREFGDVTIGAVAVSWRPARRQKMRPALQRP